MKYFKIDVELTTGFKYSYHCIERMKPGMVQASKSIWTKSVTESEITKEEFEESRNVKWEVDKKTDEVLRKAVVRSSKVVDKGKLVESKSKGLTKTPKLSSLEDFFESNYVAESNEDDEPTGHSIPTKKTGRNQKADTVKKVRARRST